MRRVSGIGLLACLAASLLVCASLAATPVAAQATTLAESIPTSGYVALNAAAYYTIDITAEDEAAITINVTPIGDGNPDLYASFDNQTPGPTSYTYRSRNWGEDTIVIPKAQYVNQTSVYLAVVGSYRASNYTIVYQVETPITLSDGQGQYSSVLKGGLTYFDFHATEKASLTVSVTGRTRVYIGTTNPIIPYTTGTTTSNALWWSTYISGVVTIDASDANWPTSTNQFYLAVYGVADSTFMLTVTLNGTATQLPNGLAIASELDQNDNAYFAYSVGTAGCQLQFSLSVVYGDPDLYVSQTVEKPNPVTCPDTSTACNASRSYGGDSITFDPATLGDYHIGVYSYTPSSFTILAQTVCPEDSYNSSATQLEDGVSQHGALPKRTYRYYSFVAPSELTNITFSLSSRVGDPDMYIRNDDTPPTRYTYQWSASHVGSDIITVKATDPQACTSCTYYIYVYAFTDTDFYISASTPNEQVLLFESQPLQNYLATGQSAFYAISVYVSAEHERPLVISVTDLGSGNPDLLVSTTNPTPSLSDSTSYQWSATRWQDDSVNIFPTDPNYCVGQCTYYVGVTATTATTYSIVFHMAEPTSLTDGMPQQGVVPASAYNFYQFRVLPGYQQVQFSLAATSGFANLLISNDDHRLPVLSNSSSYQEYVPWYTGTMQLVTITEGGVGSCTMPGTYPNYCTYLIGVQGFLNCSYTISAVTNTSISQLTSGVARPGAVSNTEWQFFRFDVSDAGQQLSVVLTATSGDPDLYISLDNLPDITHHNYSSSHIGGDSVTIANAPAGVYFIGVYGWSAYDSTFTVLATLTDGSATDVIQLTDGEQQAGVAAAGAYIYYAITIGSGVSQLFLAVAKTSGDPDIYVRYDASTVTTLPTRLVPTSYQWKSNSVGDDTITITNPAAGIYTIGVQAFATAASFTIAVSTGLTYQRLSDGVSRRGIVGMHAYSYFRIWMDSPSDLTVTLTPLSGDPDLFVATSNDHPNSTNSDWSSTAFMSDSVTVPHGSSKACTQCWYYIGVYGFFQSTFIVTANFGNEQQLIEGVPVDGSATAGGGVFYSFDMATINSGSISIAVTAASGLPSIYASMHDEPDTAAGDYDYYQAATFSGATLTLDAATICALPTATTPCILHIQVHAEWTTTFTVLATWTKSDRNIQLINGRSASGSLAKGGYEYYTINVPAQNMDLIVSVVPFSGDADLYMSNTIMQPNATVGFYTWRSRAAGTDTVTIHNAAVGDYYIGVNAYSATSFSVTAYAYAENSTNVPLQLVDGVPQSSVLGASDWRYYTLDLSGAHEDLTFTVTSSLGDPDVFVTNDGTIPNTTNYHWASRRYGSDQVTIQSPPAGHYIVAIYAYSTTVYTIVGVSHEATLELVAGTSFAEDLFRGQTEYFFTRVVDTTNDLTISVTSLNGDPDLYVSDITTTPGPTNYTYSATSFRNDSITIPAALLHTGNYYIAVRAFLNCSFTILASYNGQTSLMDGRPQHDVVIKEQSKYYTFRTASSVDVTVALSPTSGYARLYVANGQEPVWNMPATYSWSSLNPYTSQMINIFANDTTWSSQSCANDGFCTFYILVRGMTDCEYSLTATSGEVGIDLQEGVPLQATVNSLSYAHFKFWVSDPTHDVAFTVTPLSGDPDLFITTAQYDTTGQGASRAFYQWKSELYGGDTIQVLYDDPGFVLGEWEISVYGWTYSSFVIVATSSPRSGNVSSIALVDGLPQGGRIRTAGDYNYFTFQPSDPTTGVAFALTRRSGDPDLFIDMYPNVPTRTSYIWQGSHVGSDYVTVNAADPRACGNLASTDDCIFMVGVRAYTATMYTIQATTTMVTGQMQSGVPLFGSVIEGQYIYYFIDVSSYNQVSLQISLTSISGDPDLYVSTVQEHPNSTASGHEWASTTYGSEDITIASPSRTNYYIAVYGWSNSSFSLTATFSQPVMLEPGQPYSDSIGAYGGLRYYTLPIDTGATSAPPNGLTISLSASVNGYVDMYLQNNGSFAAPGQTNGWTALATSASAGRYIYVSATDAQACWTGNNCTYSLAVRSRSYGSFQYTLTYYYGDAVITLEPAVPFSAIVKAGEYVQFRGMVSTTSKSVSISSTQLIGDITVYAAQNVTTPESGIGNYTWLATTNSTLGTHIAISSTDADLSIGWMFISVYGNTDASFSILMTTANTMLVSGSPQAATCSSTSTPQYYFMNFEPQSDTSGTLTDIIIDLAATHTLLGASVTASFDLWVTTDLAQPGNTMPNATYAVWYETVTDGQEFRISSTDANYCTSACTIYIAIKCPKVAAGGGYTLTASTSDVLEVLAVNSQSLGYVSSSSEKFYQVYLASATNFSFVLEPCVGEVDLYVSTSYNRPDSSHNENPSNLNTNLAPAVYYYSAPAGTSAINSVFFGVQQVATEVAVDSYFNVHAMYVDQFQSTSPVVSNSILTTTALEKGVVKFLFKPAKSTVGTPATELVYSLFWTTIDDVNAVLYTQCGAIASKGTTGHAWRNFTGVAANEYYSVSLEDLDDTTYQFNIIVYDPSPLSVSGATAYTVQQARPNGSADNGSSSRTLKIVLGIAIPLGILLLVLLGYCYVKNRRLTKELSVEMHDVPAAALRKAARGAPDVSAVERARNHHALLSENEEDSAGHYIAPHAVSQVEDL